MTLEVQSFAELDAAQVLQAYDTACQLLAELHPNLETRRGIVSALVTKVDALYGAAMRMNIARLQQSQSVLAITQNPALADDSLVDAVIANSRLTRKPAQAATGEVTIVLDSLLAVTINNGSIFEANGQQYAANATYAARTAVDNILTATDKLISQIATGQYAFTIFVTALNAGSAGVLKKDTLLTPLSAPNDFVAAYATSDFTGGLDAQTNAELMDLLASGQAARAFSGRDNILALIKEALPPYNALYNTAFTNILALSLVGMRDPEMTRDQHWLFPVSGGGRTDVYLRSQALPKSLPLVMTASLIDSTPQGGIWQFTLGRDAIPGFYEVTKIIKASAPTTQSGYDILADLRSLDVTGANVPDLQTAIEGVHTAYQTATIRFLDTDTPTGTAIGDTADYALTVTAMPLIKELQAYLTDRGVSAPMADTLVKGAVPCNLSLSFTVERRRPDAVVDATLKAQIANALAAYVNNTGFAGRLYASDLSRIVAEMLPAYTNANAIDMFGRIVRPDGERTFVRSRDILVIPDDPAHGISARTTIFVLDPESVAIAVENIATLTI
jgi:Baseplate J-like protein